MGDSCHSLVVMTNFGIVFLATLAGFIWNELGGYLTNVAAEGSEPELCSEVVLAKGFDDWRMERYNGMKIKNGWELDGYYKKQNIETRAYNTLRGTLDMIKIESYKGTKAENSRNCIFRKGNPWDPNQTLRWFGDCQFVTDDMDKDDTLGMLHGTNRFASTADSAVCPSEETIWYATGAQFNELSMKMENVTVEGAQLKDLLALFVARSKYM